MTLHVASCSQRSLKSDHRRGRDQLSRQFAAARLRGIERGLERMHLCENPPNREEDSTMCERNFNNLYFECNFTTYLSFFYTRTFVKYLFGSFSRVKFNTKERRVHTSSLNIQSYNNQMLKLRTVLRNVLSARVHRSLVLDRNDSETKALDRVSWPT